MSIVEELEEKLEAVREKATGELSEVADKVQEAFHKLVEDNGVADEVTEKVAGVLKVAADKLEVAAEKVSGLFEDKTLTSPGDAGVTPPMTVTEHGSLAPGFEKPEEDKNAQESDEKATDAEEADEPRVEDPKQDNEVPDAETNKTLDEPKPGDPNAAPVSK